MLSDENYKALLSFRNGLVPNDRKLTEREEMLRQAGFISLVQRRETKQGDGYSMTYDQAHWKITVLGEDALKELEEYAEKERDARAREDADKKEQDAKDAVDRRKQFKRDIVVAIIGSAVGGIVVLATQNWPSVVSFITNLFQK